MMKTEKKPDAPKSAEVIFFPRARIIRTILRDGRVYDPGKLYPEWDEERRRPDPKGAA